MSNMKWPWLQRLFAQPKQQSWLREITSGSLYRISDIRGDSSTAKITTQINVMRNLARDSQISTTLSYYATDATTVNTNGQIIWAVPKDPNNKVCADIINEAFDRWNIKSYARDHILELATIGNLYIPTTDLYKQSVQKNSSIGVALSGNTIPDENYDIIPSTKIPPEDIIHLWYHGAPQGYIIESKDRASDSILYPESAVIHFSMGGMMGDYTISMQTKNGENREYDVQFAQPPLQQAAQPTQTLSLLEDALLLSSLIRVIRIVAVECGNDADNDEEVRSTLQQVKDMFEQQMSLNTNSGDAQSFLNPQSPNNLIFVPRINGQDPISITDLNMSDTSEEDYKLLQHYQNKKLSVLGIPKEALNFSSTEGLGGAGAVMSQRSGLYANLLQRIENAYIAGWTDALNKYFRMRNLSGFVNQYKLMMNPIVTLQSTINFDKRSSALDQATNIVSLLKDLGVTNPENYVKSITEILSEVLPETASQVMDWNVSTAEEGEHDEY